MLPTPGHTADHAAVVLSSDGQTAIYLGDLVHHAVQLERLPWIPAFDTLPLVTLETKRKLCQRAVDAGALLISTHVEFPGTGRLSEVDGRRHWTAE
jgi:glyoxylase-like metal-dependent hydrolase (beta-lactamase superfamily II)